MSSKKQYTRTFRNFRGVDFTSDAAEVEFYRFPEAVNVWRDYLSEGGGCVETMPGYRRIFNGEQSVYDIHEQSVYDIHKLGDDLIIHVGAKYYFCPFDSLQAAAFTEIDEGGGVTIPQEKTLGVVFQNKLWLIGGGRFNVISKGESGYICENTILSYTPLIYVNGEAYEQPSLLTTTVWEKFTQVTANTSFELKGINIGLTSVTVNEEVLSFSLAESGYLFESNGRSVKKYTSKGVEIAFTYSTESGVSFKTSADIDEILVEGVCNSALASSASSKYSGFPSSFLGADKNPWDAISNCSVICVHDDRIFLTGNPSFPNTTFYCSRDVTGVVNPRYWGIYNYFNDGIGEIPNVAMVSIGGALTIFKANSNEGVGVYYRTASDTEDNLVPRIYMQTEGPQGSTCLGQCCNFLDDCVFVSKRGLDALDKLGTNLERGITHRSSLVDRRLLTEDLSKAMLAEWQGYLVLLFPSGNAYLADSRATCQKNGTVE